VKTKIDGQLQMLQSLITINKETMLLIETYIKESPGKGLGVFTKEFIPKGKLIWEFVGGFDIKVHKEKYKTLSDVQKKHIDTYFWKEGDYLYSSCDYSNFQNHSYNPNSIGFGENRMIAARDIYPDEEILVNYYEFDDDFDLYKEELI
jgi:SET domain-containing protein